MKFSSKALLLTAAVSAGAPLLAQGATARTRPATRRATASSAAAAACSKLPDISSKVPALPAGLPCAKPLYTITTVPSVRLDYISPMEPATLQEDLGIESSSFSLSYVDVKQGTGEPVSKGKFLSIHYSGYLTDGTKFDSSLDRKEPITIPYGGHQVIPGWDTGLDGMRVGGKRRLYIPFQLAYGAQGRSGIPPRSFLIFDVELVSVSQTPPPPPAKPTPAPGTATPPPPGAAGPRPANATTPPVTTAPPAGTADPGSKPATPATDPTAPTTVPPKP